MSDIQETMHPETRIGYGFYPGCSLNQHSPPAGVVWKFGEGATAEVTSSSSDIGLKLQSPSQNSPRVASKRDVNITKTKLNQHCSKTGKQMDALA
ncbi:hypothetical protein AVEN_242181-1 [Araneus ventricosus]|uniref:Uncharacterized protein n=1 Tax=Araneus ventricosus TaxID=182803 RepID=A0A4Y2DEC4_ARAVE|nr:hypothetical protein AVEN_242181-1 [Araneus ventricosus]